MSNEATAAQPKVLLVSDILGTPNANAAWRDYSIALLETLKALGADVTLVVERAFGFEDETSRPDAETRLSAIYSYLATGDHRPKLFYRGLFARILARHAPAVLRRIGQRRQRSAEQEEVPVVNRSYHATDVPETISYLLAVNRFLFLPRFYSAAKLKAVFDTGPAEIDGSSFDLVLIDGLLPVRVTGCDALSLATVVHDLAAVSAPDTPIKQRLIAGQALSCMGEHQGAALFTDEHVRQQFKATCNMADLRDLTILGPLVSSRLRDLASGRDGARSPSILASLERKALKADFIRMTSPAGILFRLTDSLMDISKAEADRRDEGKTGSLPYIVVMWPEAPERALDPSIALARELSEVARVLIICDRILSDVFGSKKALAKAPSNLEVLERLSWADRSDVIRCASLVVYLGRSSAGSSLLEAAAHGTSLLCFDTPLNRAFAGRANASFVRRGDRDVLAAHVMRHLRSSESGQSFNETSDRRRLSALPTATSAACDIFRELLTLARSGAAKRRGSAG